MLVPVKPKFASPALAYGPRHALFMVGTAQRLTAVISQMAGIIADNDSLEAQVRTPPEDSDEARRWNPNPDAVREIRNSRRTWMQLVANGLQAGEGLVAVRDRLVQVQPDSPSLLRDWPTDLDLVVARLATREAGAAGVADPQLLNLIEYHASDFVDGADAWQPSALTGIPKRSLGLADALVIFQPSETATTSGDRFLLEAAYMAENTRRALEN